MAPEVWAFESFTEAADWYSFGRTLLFMETQNMSGLREDVQDVKLDDLLFNEHYGILNKDPKKRLTGEQILVHPYFVEDGSS